MAFDFDAAVSAPFRMQPGLRRLAPGTPQFTPTAAPHRGVSRHLREKLAVLWAFGDQALCAVPGFDAGPALAAVAAQAAAEHPQALQTVDDHWRASGLGWALDGALQPVAIGHDWPEIGTLLARLAPDWRRAALLSLAFAEDLAVVDADSGTLPWLAVALPSMWAPEAKVGLHFAAVHAPVADNTLILQAADRLVALVTAGERWERFVWTLTGHPRLHAHPRRVPPERWAPGLTGDALAAQTWFRTEHQTFIPVPGRRQAVFTILVDTQPMAQALASPARAARVHDALATMSDAVLAYRGLTEVRAPLLGWLAARAAG
jgi:dimethylamine monooxygenase subunit A